MPRLEYSGGPNPFRDINGFVAKAKQKFPGISNDGINQMVRKMVLGHERVSPVRSIALFGRDILSADVEHLEIWPKMAPSHRLRILAHPYDTGERVDGESPKVSQLELVGRLDRGSVNRSVLISPRGLEKTYAWNKRTDFVQDVTEKDAEIIMTHPSLRRKFHNLDEYGPLKPVRAYNEGINVVERHFAKDMGDVEALKRQYSSKPQFSGADMKQKGN